MENVTADIITNQSDITIPQPPSDVCKTCIDLVITNGVLGGVQITVVIAVALFVVCCRKRSSELILSTWKYGAILIFLAIVPSVTSLGVVIKLILTCKQVDPMKCSVRYGWIVFACFIFLSIVVYVAILVYLHYQKETSDREAKVHDLRTLIERVNDLCQNAKDQLEFIKNTIWIDEAEEMEQKLQKTVNDWNTTITKAAELKEALQSTQKRDDVPLISEALEKEIQRTRPKSEEELIPNYIQYLQDAMDSAVQYDNNIGDFTHKASKEMQFKKEEISLGKLKSWKNNQKSFYPTKATEHIYKEVKSKRNCLTTGLPGSGKTANLQHIALRLKNEGHRLCCVQTFKELLSKVDKFGEEEKHVYFVDDVFGVHGVSEDKTKEWTGADKDDLERCFNNTNISILCSSRKQVTDDPKLSNIKSRFTIINISEGEFGLSSEEHVGIFEKHAITKQRKNLLTENKDQLKTEIKEKVREVKCPVGCFPLVCYLYTGEEEPKQTIKKYFNKPLNVIADHLEQLKVEDRLSHFCLLLCLIYDNKLPVNIITVGDESKETEKQRKELLELCKLPVATSREDIREKMDTLLQTFVKLEGDMYHFVHDIIHDAVIKHVSGLPSTVHQFIIRHCSSKFMRYRVHLSGVECEDKWGTPGHDTESCINIRPNSFTYWGERVLDIVRDGVRTSDQLYNDIDEGRCSIDDDRVWYNPWEDVFKYNPCVHSTEGQTAIVQALKSSDVQTIMCTKGYSLSYRGPRVTGLHWAIDRGLTHIVTQTMSMLSQTQIREVVSIHDRGLLYRAISERCGTDVIQALIVGGADVNTPDVIGRTPLYLAIREGCGTDVIQALIVGGADVNTPDVIGRTPLYLAIREGCSTDVIQALIVGGVDVNTPDVRGDTPLCLAINRGCSTDVIQALIVGGADVNTPDVFGHTPLHWSVSCGDYKITQLLVDNGADANQCDKYGRSVLYKSQLMGRDTITELLQSRGAVCIYEGKRYTTITDIPDSELDDEWERERIQELKWKQNMPGIALFDSDTDSDTEDSEVDDELDRWVIQTLKEKQNVTK